MSILEKQNNMATTAGFRVWAMEKHMRTSEAWGNRGEDGKRYTIGLIYIYIVYRVPILGMKT